MNIQEKELDNEQNTEKTIWLPEIRERQQTWRNDPRDRDPVDLTAIEKKIDEAGFGPIKIGLQELSDDDLMFLNAAGVPEISGMDDDADQWSETAETLNLLNTIIKISV